MRKLDAILKDIDDLVNEDFFAETLEEFDELQKEQDAKLAALVAERTEAEAEKYRR